MLAPPLPPAHVAPQSVLLPCSSIWIAIGGEDSVAVDNIAAEVNELLQEAGKQLTQRVGTIINGKLDRDGHAIHTDAYLNRQNAILRGFFAALASPIALSAVRQRFQTEDVRLSDLVSEMIASGAVTGTLEGKGEKGRFVPALFQQAQQQYLESFFSANNYIDVVDLPQAVAEQVQPRLQASFEQKVAEVVASHGDDQVDQRKLREELIGQYRLELVAKHINRTLGLDALHIIVKFMVRLDLTPSSLLKLQLD
ncbi:uncharacterized protein MONBRDRAFT_5520 [Monosiga brevicollis MX1]|uniref:E3 UFM1-protein ligase 1-like N-terminal domain-containing protein n=1 Tax=Monosiga brevicollis TaxID=81824 RepID=A9URP4_MONBE|nr:uncharacterized protein MONBRDRAFT_5520 [Monosiga brevicollis MX1]EDQ91961.1 predicted protein [Monosiga brevicollis MX1]|eukprot:XP_001743247.1 hypothetical protein [Monosiga brevicollis MX1]